MLRTVRLAAERAWPGICLVLLQRRVLLMRLEVVARLLLLLVLLLQQMELLGRQLLLLWLLRLSERSGVPRCGAVHARQRATRASRPSSESSFANASESSAPTASSARSEMRGARERGVAGRGTPRFSLAGSSVARLGGVCWAEALTCGLGSETGAVPSGVPNGRQLAAGLPW